MKSQSYFEMKLYDVIKRLYPLICDIKTAIKTD